jgi:DNA helicase-2/ATP-dependent DNA helicase PcrA
MKLTPDQRNAARCDENLMLTACPGSGKTRVIISKLIRTIEDVRATARTVACITYTNAAVHEIESRLRLHIQPGDDAYYHICTIHSFCLNHIFRPFCHLIESYKKGFKVLTPESEEFERLAKAVAERFGRYNLSYRDLEEFTLLRLDANGQPAGPALTSGSLTPEIADAYWKGIQAAGYIDFASIIYHSFELLRERPEILEYVSSKFAWILVDEFQDTTDLQVEILGLIADAERTRFLLVGDPLQSIYSFAGARPDLAEQFARKINARTDITLSGNFRSSPPITGDAEKLYARNPAMTAMGPAKKFTEKPTLQNGKTALEVITDYFLPALDELEIPVGDAAILAPAWFTLYNLGRQLRTYGVSIVGPGARPYRRNRQFAPLAEQVCGYLMELDPDAIAGIERTLFNTLLDVTGRPYFDIFSYQGRLVVFRLIFRAEELRRIHQGAIAWLEAAAVVFTEVLTNEDYLRADPGST